MSAATLKKRIPSSIFSQSHTNHHTHPTTDFTAYPWLTSHTASYNPSYDTDDDLNITTDIPPNTIISSIIRIILRPINEAIFFLSWLVWLIAWIPLAGGSTVVAMLTMLRIVICICLYLFVISIKKFNAILFELYWKLACYRHRHNRANLAWIRHSLLNSKTWEEWRYLAGKMDRLEGNESWKRQNESTLFDYNLLSMQLQTLQRCRHNNDIKALMFSLSNIFHRQYCGIDNEQLYLHCHLGTKYLIEEFYAQVVEQLSYIAQTDFGNTITLRDKLQFFQRARKSYGKTALCLSGGGALAMYHAGVCRALLFANCLPDIINGTSGGAIIAGVMATRTDAELRAPTFLTPDIANRFGVHWLPSLPRQARHFLKHGVLMDWREFANTARTYYWDLTFEEAYKRTRRHVSITVSYSTARTMQQGHAMVCNHITTPHVLIWSAVTASCSLPGLMQAQTLFAKTFANEIVPYYPKGTEWVDGSLHADIPVQRLTELFNAQVFLVSQVNPHVRPFITGNARIFGGFNDERSGVTTSYSLLNEAEKMLASDIAHRLGRLAKMKIIPKIYGQDFRPVWDGRQRYTGDITVAPDVSFRMQLKVISQPSNSDMIEFIRNGESATWPVISRVQNAMIIERTLDECIKVLARQLRHSERRAGRTSVTKSHPPISEHKSPPIAEPERGKLGATPLRNTVLHTAAAASITGPGTALRAKSEPAGELGVASSIEPHEISGPHQAAKQQTPLPVDDVGTGTVKPNTVVGIAYRRPPATHDDDIPLLSAVDTDLAPSSTHRPNRPSNIIVSTLDTFEHAPAHLPTQHARTPSASGKFVMPTSSYHASDSDNDDLLMEVEELYTDSPISMSRKMSQSSVLSPLVSTSPAAATVTSPVDTSKIQLPPRPSSSNNVSRKLYK